MHYDPTRKRLTASHDELRRLVRLVTGLDPADTAPPEWVEAGLVADGTVHPTVAALAVTSVAGDRAVAIERLAGPSVVPLMVSWHRSGRATLTEHRPDDAGDGTLTITATHVELLPQLLLQAVGLSPDLPVSGRPAIETTAGVVDDAIVSLARDRRVTSIAASADLSAVLEHAEHVVRATGSWQGGESDESITFICAGSEGVWLVDRDALDDDARQTSITVAPSTVVDVAARLGDVVTGRRSRPEQAA
ncbi:MAG: hypothetical protein QNJ12_15095 [Ilumatobacter sp.]|uniref:hypothetical protein n=1 Tax=Ilumatobacter sp. TaxID=1967498 RepID=UPI00261687C0|nr:hypothetical protein [Ilumatobacter sp.]MDJ0770126.1 hypothetical protein [Ilumatobacter sp.]